MIRALVILAVALALLTLADGSLRERAAAERAARARVGRLVPEEEAADLAVRCLEVQDASGNSDLYLPYFGRWRCRTHAGAPADEAQLRALIEGLLTGEGVVHSESPTDPAAYGIGAARTWRVTLHGEAALQPPHEDPLVSFDLGTPLPGRDACFVRRVGESRVWLLERNPRAGLDAPPVAGLPPLLAPHVLPADWPGFAEGLARLRVETAAGGLVLEKRVPPPDPGADPRERPRFLWVLDPGPGESLAASLQATAFSLFLQRLPYRDVRGPSDRALLGLDAPRSAIVLEAADGTSTRLLVASPLPDGRVPLWNEATGRPYVLEAEVAELLTPPREVFATESDANPWDPYLHR